MYKQVAIAYIFDDHHGHLYITLNAFAFYFMFIIYLFILFVTIHSFVMNKDLYKLYAPSYTQHFLNPTTPFF